MKKDPNKYPRGWNRKQVERLVQYYDSQTPEEIAAEMEAAYKDKRTTLISVPTNMVLEVQKVISKKRRRKSPSAKTKSPQARR